MADRWSEADRVAALALEIVGAVRDEEPARLHARLEGIGRREPLLLRQLVVALAAMVPDDRPLSALLAWTTELDPRSVACEPDLDRSPASSRAEHGTRPRYVAGCRGTGCSLAQARYDADRPPRRTRLTVVPPAGGGHGEETG